MMVKVERRFTLEVDYDEAYLLRAALIGLSGEEFMSEEGNEARLAMLQQIEGLLSLASGVTADGLPFLRGLAPGYPTWGEVDKAASTVFGKNSRSQG